MQTYELDTRTYKGADKVFATQSLAAWTKCQQALLPVIRKQMEG